MGNNHKLSIRVILWIIILTIHTPAQLKYYSSDLAQFLYETVVPNDNLVKVKEILEDGWDPRKEEGIFHLPLLHNAICYGSYNIAQYLITNGVDINQGIISNGLTPLILSSLYITAPDPMNRNVDLIMSRNRNIVKIIKLLLANPSIDLNKKTISTGQTAKEAFEHLIKQDYNKNNYYLKQAYELIAERTKKKK